MTPILKVANLTDVVNAVNSKPAQKNELSKGFGEEFSKALANANTQNQTNSDISNNGQPPAPGQIRSARSDAGRHAAFENKGVDQNSVNESSKANTANTSKLSDKDVQINPAKPTPEKNDGSSTGKLSGDTTDTSLPVKKQKDEETTSSGDISAMLSAIQWMHADPVKPSAVSQAEYGKDPGNGITADPLQTGSLTDKQFETDHGTQVTADPTQTSAAGTFGKTPGVQVTADPTHPDASARLANGADPGLHVTADPKTDAHQRLDNTTERRASGSADQAGLKVSGEEVNQSVNLTKILPHQENIPDTATIQTNTILPAEMLRTMSDASGKDVTSSKKPADQSKDQSDEIALKRRTEIEQSGDVTTRTIAKSDVAATRLDGKFREMLEEFRISTTDVRPGVNDASENQASNTVRNFSDAFRTFDNTQVSSQQLTQTTRIPVRVGNEGWNTAIGQHMLRMSTEQMKSAELELNPPELGPLKIVLDLQSDQLSTTFVTGSAQVQQALEASVPRLQEMMSQAGYQLNQVNVQTSFHDGQREAPQQQAQLNGRANNSTSGTGENSARDSITETGNVRRQQNIRQGGVDMFV